MYIFNGMEFGLRPLSIMEFLQNSYHQAVNKIKILLTAWWLLIYISNIYLFIIII